MRLPVRPFLLSHSLLGRGINHRRTPRQVTLLPTTPYFIHHLNNLTPNSKMAEAKEIKPVDTTRRVQALREQMNKPEHNVQAYVIPSEDAHQSEYSAECDRRRAFISGFTGSAGTAVVTTDQAALFTDGRYHLQASMELDGNWTLMKSGLPEVPTWQEWLAKLPSGSRIGVDPTLITAVDAHQLEKTLSDAGSTIVPIAENLVDIAWGAERPSRPLDPLTILPLKYTGKSHADKIKDLREELEKKEAHGFVVSGLDEIAWLLNVRGSDVQYNPVFYAYALVTRDDVILYIDSAKVPTDVKQHLGNEVTLKPYGAIFEDLKATSAQLNEGKSKLLLSDRASWALEDAIGKDNAKLIRSPITDMKAVKNKVELEGMRQCHLRDAAALCNFFAWIEEELNAGKRITEYEAAERLEKFRAEQADFVGPSFETISSTGPNGAIIHYSPKPGTCDVIQRDQVYLLDSGGQYKDGTTDVTRTYHFAQPTSAERDSFTRVLQGHIAIDTAIFPQGTSGYRLDILARAPLWRDGLDYRHGTGHGVGSFLNVHEGPMGIGTRIAYNDVPLEPGHVLSNEPGYYEDGKYGIRIESIVFVKEVETRGQFGGKPYLGFEHVTLVPIQTKMINVDLLTPFEREWVNAYHQDCREKVSRLLKPGSPGLAWLERETQKI
ncbi:uncharacterized protein VTP21DRAFT_10087 [Calcarisporiella thermophila]|uniref:uncharacterized protein n=1 Tax=Calcarisporiella thermophila TaxID=911321 RepID=UPI0037446D7A